MHLADPEWVLGIAAARVHEREYAGRPTGRALRVQAPAAELAQLELAVVEWSAPAPGPDEALIQVRAAAVNPSDAKAALGRMPHATWPRTPGRDYAGVVVAGPEALLGRRVWGCGGDLGIRRDGTHAGWLVPNVIDPWSDAAS